MSEKVSKNEDGHKVKDIEIDIKRNESQNTVEDHEKTPPKQPEVIVQNPELQGKNPLTDTTLGEPKDAHEAEIPQFDGDLQRLALFFGTFIYLDQKIALQSIHLFKVMDVFFALEWNGIGALTVVGFLNLLATLGLFFFIKKNYDQKRILCLQMSLIYLFESILVLISCFWNYYSFGNVTLMLLIILVLIYLEATQTLIWAVQICRILFLNRGGSEEGIKRAQLEVVQIAQNSNSMISQNMSNIEPGTAPKQIEAAGAPVKTDTPQASDRKRKIKRRKQDGTGQQQEGGEEGREGGAIKSEPSEAQLQQPQSQQQQQEEDSKQ